MRFFKQRKLFGSWSQTNKFGRRDHVMFRRLHHYTGLEQSFVPSIIPWKDIKPDWTHETMLQVGITESFFHFWSFVQKFTMIVLIFSSLLFLLFCLFSLNFFRNWFFDDSRRFLNLFFIFLAILLDFLFNWSFFNWTLFMTNSAQKLLQQISFLRACLE